MSQSDDGGDLPPPIVNGVDDVATTMVTLVAEAVNATGKCEDKEGILVWGIVAIGIFYLAVLLVGVWAGWKQRRGGGESTTEDVMLAGRDIGIFVGVLTMGATWVGGGFINGSAEEAWKAGLIWTQAPFGYGLSLFISGTFFARKMRNSRYVTMIDPFTQKYGRWGALQALPAAMSEIFWSASILGALGSTLQVILKIDIEISIIVSAIIAVLYTLLGGLISVAYTDVIQIFFIFVGLILALPFAWTHPAVGDVYEHFSPGEGPDIPKWYGVVDTKDWGLWIDYAFLLLLGGIPWQAYYQRVLSSKTAGRAQMLSYGGGLIALFFTGPSVLFGAVAKATRWNETDYAAQYACAGDKIENTSIIMPLTLQYLTPPVVAFFGLGAISAAVMSSTDSSMLSASTMVARNVYQRVFRPNCKEREVIYALWVCIVINCCIATTLAIVYKSIYTLFVLCGDFVFVIVFPQLLLVLYWNKANTYGSVFSFFIGLLLRLLCGEPKLGLPATISFGLIPHPDYGSYEECKAAQVLADKCMGDDYDTAEKMEGCYEGLCTGPVPFRTICMILSLILHLVFSYAAHYLFTREKVDLQWDFFDCFETVQTGKIVLRASRELDENEEITMADLAKHPEKKISIPRAKSVDADDMNRGSYTNRGYN